MGSQPHRSATLKTHDHAVQFYQDDHFLYDVITNGFGAMPDHAAQIKVRDRWAIAAYLRALQAAASGTVDDVPASQREQLDRPAPAAETRP